MNTTATFVHDDIMDAPFEQIVSPDEPLFTEAKAAGRIYKVRRVS